MALVLYSSPLFFPSGNPAANVLLPVRPRASNQLALLFTNASGLSPASNPVLTDASGYMTFWAAPGDYVAWLAGSLFPIEVDDSFTDPVWADLWIHAQSTPATEWTVDHHFGVRPQVEVLIGTQQTSVDIMHVSSETTLITFGDPVTGSAYLRR